MIDVLLTGALGVMGGMVRDAISQTQDLRIIAGVDIAPNDSLPFPVYPSLDAVREAPQVVLDFSHFSALSSILDYCLERQLPVVICATGHTMEQRREIQRAAERIPVFFSANMSLGVNLIKHLSQEAASLLEPAYDIEILEKHHNRKIDAPSGTANMLAEAINEAVAQPKSFVYERHSKREPRKKTDLGIHSIRGGTTVGEHSVLFYGEDEVVELTHIANSRRIFATGAVSALRYIAEKGPGLYSMDNLFAEDQAVTDIRSLSHQTLFNLAGKLSPDAFLEIFAAIAQEGIPVDVITYSFSGVISHLTLSVDNAHSAVVTAAISPILDRHGLSMDLMADLSKITIRGPGMEFEAGVGARLFRPLIQAGIPPLSVATSEEKIVLLVPGKMEEQALSLVAQEYAR